MSATIEAIRECVVGRELYGYNASKGMVREFRYPRQSPVCWVVCDDKGTVLKTFALSDWSGAAYWREKENGKRVHAKRQAKPRTWREKIRDGEFFDGREYADFPDYHDGEFHPDPLAELAELAGGRI